MKKIGILGSTGSIGTQTLEVVRNNRDIQVTALAAGSNIDLLEQQIREFKPGLAAVWSKEKADDLRIRVRDLPVRVVSGKMCIRDRKLPGSVPVWRRRRKRQRIFRRTCG